MPLPLLLFFETPSHRVSLAGLELSFCCLCLLGSGLKVCATTPTTPSSKKPSCLRLCHDLIQQLKDFLSILLAHEFSVCMYVYVHACACACVPSVVLKSLSVQKEQQKKLEQTVEKMKQRETTARKKQQELTAC